jgi:hypothetical protein
VIEKPAGSGYDIRFPAEYFSARHARIFIDSCRNNVPLYIGTPDELGLQGGQSQRGMRIRTVQVKPKDFHEEFLLKTQISSD